MLPLPPIPLHLGWRERVRLGRDYYVRLGASDYSVDPAAIQPGGLDFTRVVSNDRRISSATSINAAVTGGP